MGAVYRVTHVMLGKPVALKLIRPEIITSPEVVRRFQREARAASLLTHPNIVTIHDLGQAEDGTLYLAMELCAGTTLKDVIVAEGPLDPYRAARLCRAIAGALALAHKHRIVHRDLKPQNVMVARTAEGHETPKLLDFGIAKAVETDGVTLTSTGMVLGTPRYLSPEQAKSLSVDGRSDLDSLGIIFYEMLVGHVPFDDPSIPSLLVKHMAEPPRPPSELRPEVPAAIESIVLRLLEKDPARRFQSAEDLSAALAAIEPVAPVSNAPHDKPKLKMVPKVQDKSLLDRINIVVAQDSHPPFDVAAVVLEEDTALILSTNVVIRETKEHVISLMTDLYQYKEKTPGSVVVKGANPYRFFAIVHDFDNDPSCRKEWVESALHRTLQICNTFNIESLGLQLLGTRYGPIEDEWFIDRVRMILAETTNSQLMNLWIMIPDHCAPDKILDRISLGK